MRHKYILRGTYLVVLFLIFFSFNTYAQVGIGTTLPNANAKLDITSTSAAPGGLLLPRLALTGLDSSAPLTGSVLAGMTVYNTASAGTGVNRVTPGFYYHDGTTWVRISGGPNKNWLLEGNEGTTPGTGANQNYLGTRDNQAMILATHNAQRLRILGNGQVIVNATTPIAGDRFTVQGAANEFAINGLTSGVNIAGVYGENFTDNGFGVFGNVAAGFGVVGQSTGGGRGVHGSNNGAGQGVIGFGTVNGVGVQGQNSGAGLAILAIAGNNGVGLHAESGANGDGINGMVAGTGDGVYGQNAGTGNGVQGLSNNATGFGIKARHLNNAGAALLAVGANWGAGTYLSGTGISSNGDDGIFSWGKTLDGTGVMGTGNNSISIIVNANGGGIAGSGTRNGVFGYAGNGRAVPANRGNAAGIFTLDTDNNIQTTGINDTRAGAILAGYDFVQPPTTAREGHSYFGGYFSGGNVNYSPSYAYVGMRWQSSTNGGSVTTGAPANHTIDYKIIGTGSVSTLVNDDSNNPRVLFAPEAPEVVFQDYGIGQLINGEVRISLDPLLSKSIHVDAQSPLKVFVTLEGDCNGVYVTNKSADGFTVKELQNGRSNVSFSWQIVASRADTKDANGNIVSKHVGVRFPIGPGPITSEAKQMELKIDENETSVKELRKSASENVKGKELSSAVVSDTSTGSEVQSQTINAELTSPTKISENTKD